MKPEDLYEGQMLIIKDIDAILSSLMLDCEKEDLEWLYNGCWVEVYSSEECDYFEIISPYSEFVIGLFSECLKYLQPAPNININIEKLMKEIEEFNTKNAINKLLDAKDYEGLQKLINSN